MSDIEERYEKLSTRIASLEQTKMKLDAELDAKKRVLRSSMEDCKKAGFNPDTIDDEIKKLKEVLVVKLDVLEADVASAEDQMRPMMKEIE